MSGLRSVSALALVGFAVLTRGVLRAEQQSTTPPDLLQRLRARYGELRSYADTGVVLHEYGVSSKDRHTFTTVFSRTPRHFRLDFRKAGGDRHVVWGDPDAFHTWTKATGAQTDYPNPNNGGALILSGPLTSSVSAKIPTLLYAKADLPSDFGALRDVVAAGTEALDGHRCERFRALARDVYGTGREVNARAMVVWLDADTQLIRQVLEEWPPLPGQINRTTTTFQPEANPTIDADRFRPDIGKGALQ